MIAATTALWGLAATAHASDPAIAARPTAAGNETAAPVKPAREADRPVSTSPTEARMTVPAPAARDLARTEDRLPLTRAASQARIERMTPMDWLSRYGTVSVGRRD